MAYLAQVYVTLKPTVSDPQGLTVQGALKRMGFSGISKVRIGKYLEISLEDPERRRAEGKLNEMCSQLLANPVIEQYHYSIKEVG